MGTHPIFESDFDCLTESNTLKQMRGDGHNMPPHMMHQFRNQQPAQKQQNGWSFSWINVVPIYTLCIVGYAIYIYFKAKSKPEEETRRNGIPKTELVELKDRLARTELAL